MNAKEYATACRTMKRLLKDRERLESVPAKVNAEAIMLERMADDSQRISEAQKFDNMREYHRGKAAGLRTAAVRQRKLRERLEKGLCDD